MKNLFLSFVYFFRYEQKNTFKNTNNKKFQDKNFFFALTKDLYKKLRNIFKR